jgi:hypothetical protein
MTRKKKDLDTLDEGGGQSAGSADSRLTGWLCPRRCWLCLVPDGLRACFRIGARHRVRARGLHELTEAPEPCRPGWRTWLYLQLVDWLGDGGRGRDPANPLHRPELSNQKLGDRRWSARKLRHGDCADAGRISLVWHVRRIRTLQRDPAHGLDGPSGMSVYVPNTPLYVLFWRGHAAKEAGRRFPEMATANPSIPRTGASLLGQLPFTAQWRLAPAVDADRWYGCTIA